VSAIGSATTLSFRGCQITVQVCYNPAHNSRLRVIAKAAFNGVFEIDRVAGRALVPIAEVHAIVARGAPCVESAQRCRAIDFASWKRSGFFELSSESSRCRIGR